LLLVVLVVLLVLLLLVLFCVPTFNPRFLTFPYSPIFTHIHPYSPRHSSVHVGTNVRPRTWPKHFITGVTPPLVHSKRPDQRLHRVESVAKPTVQRHSRPVLAPTGTDRERAPGRVVGVVVAFKTHHRHVCPRPFGIARGSGTHPQWQSSAASLQPFQPFQPFQPLQPQGPR
jgi:hypothetical protein